MIKRRTKISIIISLAFLITFSIYTVAYALVWPPSEYDNIAWTWAEVGPADDLYNCLGYATGSYGWEWPWGEWLPWDSEVTSYLNTKGYYVNSNLPSIISYGDLYAVQHFARTSGSNATIAKWGPLEVMWSGSWDPYYTSSYGHPVNYYR